SLSALGRAKWSLTRHAIKKKLHLIEYDHHFDRLFDQSVHHEALRGESVIHLNAKLPTTVCLKVYRPMDAMVCATSNDPFLFFFRAVQRIDKLPKIAYRRRTGRRGKERGRIEWRYFMWREAQIRCRMATGCTCATRFPVLHVSRTNA
ncbi:hypothetical protein Tcan_10988, partial [Toxocara canis]